VRKIEREKKRERGERLERESLRERERRGSYGGKERGFLKRGQRRWRGGGRFFQRKEEEEGKRREKKKIKNNIF